MIEVSKIYHNGKPLRDVVLEDFPRVLNSTQNQFFWLGLRNPDRDLIQTLKKTFQLHEMLIEDALEHRQHPKIEWYKNHDFLSLNTSNLRKRTVVSERLKIIIFKQGIISIVQGSLFDYLPIKERCHNFSDLNSFGVNFIFYCLIDKVIDDLVEVTSHVHKIFEHIEEKFISQKTLKDAQIFQLYLLRRDLLKIQSALIPLVEITHRLQSRDEQYIDPHFHPYLRDLYFNSVQVNNDIHNLIEMISYAFEAVEMIADARENTIQQKLGSWGAILAVPALVGAVYGMNFDVMPELHWKYSYYVVILISAMICGFLYVRFRQIGWL